MVVGDETDEQRRRSPRVAAQGIECRLEMRTKVRLVDISLSGALLSADAPLPVGTRAQLRAGVGAGSFCPDIRVERLGSRSDQGVALGWGTVFLDMDEASRRSLENFLRKASE
jgi:PilZ domain